MPPNVVDTTEPSDHTKEVPKNIREGPEKVAVENGNIPRSAPVERISDNERKLRTYTATVNSLGHILIGAVTLLALIFAFSGGLPLGATPLHIVLCVLGYQFLMAEAILSLASSNGWSSHLRLVDKRRAHYILQIMGSVLAIAGSFIVILAKTEFDMEHWDSLHGIFGLVALVFTIVSLVNGLSSLWAYELRGILPGYVSKLTHICFGTIGFFASSISLCYGFDMDWFREWVSDATAYTAIILTAAFSYIVILAPAVTFYQKSISLVRR